MTTDEIAAAIEANMPNVTPGEWEIKERLGKDEAWCDWHSVGPFQLMGGSADANSHHIALCNQANISALLAERKAMWEEIEQLTGVLRTTRAIVSEGAATGFNYAEGSWAERLYANQASISSAISDRAALKETAND